MEDVAVVSSPPLELIFSLPSSSFRLSLQPSTLIGEFLRQVSSTSGIAVPELRFFADGADGDTPLHMFPDEPLGSLGLQSGDTLKLRQSRAVGGGSGSGSGEAAGAGSGGGGAAAPPKRLHLGSLRLGVAPPVAIPVELYPSLSWDDITGSTTPVQLHAILQANPEMRREVEQDAELSAAAASPTPEALVQLMQRRVLDSALKAHTQASRAREMEQRLLLNPSDPEAQAFLEEQIRQKNVLDNHSLAHDVMPEGFTQQPMLIINLRVNGVPLRAMVDTGAQSTIISQRTAQAAGIMRLVDTRFKGTAKGVGTGVILGKVHITPLEVGGVHCSASFTVMEKDDMDFLLGLDFLRRFAAVVDLGANKLRLRMGDGKTAEVSFLTDHELKGLKGTGAEFDSTEAARGGGGGGGGSTSSLGAGSGSGGATSDSGGSGSASGGVGGGGGGGAAMIDLSAFLPGKK